jgi:hypothetical protein
MSRTLKTLGIIVLALVTMLLAGCESESPLGPTTSSEPVIDTAPPAAPTGLAVSGTGNTVKVAWDANVVDEDFFGFMVYRVVWGVQYPMLDLPTRETHWIDDHPVNLACTYLVTALDIAGNESAWAAINFVGEWDDTRIRQQS